MAVETATPLRMTNYPVIFRGYIVKGTQDILGRVQQIEGLLPSAEREQALHTLSYALNLAEAWPDTRILLLAMAPKMEQAGYRDEWIPYLEQGIEQSQVLDDLKAEAELHFRLGMLYESRGKYEAARIQLKASIKGFRDSSFNRARALNRLAYIARQQRQFVEAIRLVEEALSLLAEQETEQAYSYLVLGAVALDKRNWPQAANYFQQAFSLWEGENNQWMMGRSLLGLGVVLKEMGKNQEAIISYQRAIAAFEEIQASIYQAIAQMNLGNVYVDLEQPLEALKFYLPANRTFQKIRDRLRQGQINYNMARAYCQLQEWDKAAEVSFLAIERYREVGNVVLLVDAIDRLGQVYLAKDQVREAAVTFQEALDWLVEIEGEPGYKELSTIVTPHLQEAVGRLG